MSFRRNLNSVKIPKYVRMTDIFIQSKRIVPIIQTTISKIYFYSMFEHYIKLCFAALIPTRKTFENTKQSLETLLHIQKCMRVGMTSSLKKPFQIARLQSFSFSSIIFSCLQFCFYIYRRFSFLVKHFLYLSISFIQSTFSSIHFINCNKAIFNTRLFIRLSTN